MLKPHSAVARKKRTHAKAYGYIDKTTDTVSLRDAVGNKIL